MADLPMGFWSGWIITLTLVSLGGLVWLTLDVYFSRAAAAPAETWDETLAEGHAPAPLWWFWFLVAALAVSVIYLMLYPGLGSFRGALAWSQGGEYAMRVGEFDAEFGAARATIAQSSLIDLRADATVVQSGRHIFNVHCAACHGADARGQANLFPSLRDAEWQWGNSEQAIVQTIAQGRQAVMPPWQPVLGDDGLASMTEYVLALSRGAAPAGTEAATGYLTYCSACHAANGEGNPLLGAPPLNDGAWLYGGDEAAVRESIGSGRTGIMPAFTGRLDAAQIRMVAAWVTAEAPAP